MITRDKVIQTIDFLDTHQVIRKNKIINNWYSIYCPFHNDGQEKKASSGINLVASYSNGQSTPVGLFHCFTCGKALSFVEFSHELIEQRTVSPEVAEWLKQNVDEDVESEFERLIPEDMVETLQANQALEVLKRKSHEDQQFVSEEELQGYRYTIQYHYDRKMTDAAISKFDVGFDPNFSPYGNDRKIPCITMPVRDMKGRTLFLCRRSIEGKFYTYPTGSKKPVYGVYELDPNAGYALLCESCINCITAWTWGYPALALFGTGNSYQLEILKKLNLNKFVLCFDGDEAGRKATEKMKRWLTRVALVDVIHMPEGKDVNDCTKDEFDELFKNRE